MSKRIADAFVIVLCVSGALFSLNLFRLDLLQSIASQNRKPVGTVTLKYNNVQRRLLDRALWSRLTVEAPLYSGDLIRVAESSSATLTINDDVIELNENTMIRIRVSSDSEGRVVIDLDSGSLSVTGSDSGGLAINVKGRVIRPAAGETLIVSAGESGMTPRLSEAQDEENSPEMPAQLEPEPELKPAITPKAVTHTAPDSPQAPVHLPQEEKLPPDVSTSSDGFLSSNAGWKTLSDSNSMSNIGITRERIDGMEREVLTINATLAKGSQKWAGATLTEENYFANVLVTQGKSKWTGNTKTDIKLIQKLINANGVRFKVLGDGQRWRIYFPTTDVTDTGYHGVTISTKEGEVSSIDISINKLNQPNWSRLPIKFIKNNVRGITIEKNDTATGSSGTSTIKVFDFEVY